MSESRFKAYDPLKCLNCDTALAADATFCPNCSQKNRKNELSLLEWFREGLSTFFHVEGRSWKTLRDLPQPGLLVTNYFNGKRTSYVHPFRLLVFSSLIFLASITYFSPQGDNGFELIQINNTGENTEEEYLKGTDPDSLTDAILSSISQHPIGNKLRTIDQLRVRIVNHDRFRLLADSMIVSGYVADSSSYLLDSLRNFYRMPQQWTGDGIIHINNDTFNFDPRTVAFGTSEDVVRDYAFKGPVEKIIAKKAVHLYQTGIDSFNQYLFSNLSWAVLIYVPLLAFGYKLFYWKRLPYYTQNLTYSATIMSVALLLFAVGIPLSQVTGSSVPLIVIGILFTVYNLLSDRKVYGVSLLHASLKLSIVALYGMFAFVIAMFIWLTGAVLLS